MRVRIRFGISALVIGLALLSPSGEARGTGHVTNHTSTQSPKLRYTFTLSKTRAFVGEPMLFVECAVVNQGTGPVQVTLPRSPQFLQVVSSDGENLQYRGMYIDSLPWRYPLAPGERYVFATADLYELYNLDSPDRYRVLARVEQDNEVQLGTIEVLAPTGTDVAALAEVPKRTDGGETFLHPYRGDLMQCRRLYYLHPRSMYAKYARYYDLMSRARNRSDDLARTTRLLQGLLEQYPQFEGQDSIRLAIARCYLKRKMFRRARAIASALLDSEEPMVKHDSISLLSEIEQQEAKAVQLPPADTLMRRLRDTPGDGLAAIQLSAHEDARAIPLALDLVRTGKNSYAALLLGRIGRPEVVPALISVLASDNSYAVNMATKALEYVVDDTSLPALIAGLAAEHPQVRQRCFDVLKWWTGLEFDYHPHGEPAQRQQALSRWQKWLDSFSVDSELSDAVQM